MFILFQKECLLMKNCFTYSKFNLILNIIFSFVLRIDLEEKLLIVLFEIYEYMLLRQITKNVIFLILL